MAHYKFKIKKAEKKFKVQNKKFDIQKLKNKEKRVEFKLELKNRFEILQESPDIVDLSCIMHNDQWIQNK
jgi:hypothetical protein